MHVHNREGSDSVHMLVPLSKARQIQTRASLQPLGQSMPTMELCCSEITTVTVIVCNVVSLPRNIMSSLHRFYELHPKNWSKDSALHAHTSSSANTSSARDSPGSFHIFFTNPMTYQVLFTL